MASPMPALSPFESRAAKVSAAVAVVLAIAVSAGWAAPGSTRAATAAYVATTGSDANPGTSARPWRTLQRAANVAPAGTVVYIRGGSYAGFTLTRPSLTFRPYGTETVAVNGSSTRPFVIRISGTTGVRIQGLIVQNAPNRYGAGIKVDKSSSLVTITKNRIRNNRSFGVLLENTSRVTVSANTITGNETGIQVAWASSGVQILSNTIANNNRMIVNDATAWNDRGANGVVFYHADGPVTVASNLISGHRAASHDYGQDGGAFEIYASSNLTIRGNRLWNNLNVLETGTDGAPCVNVTFTRNLAYGGADGGARSQGLILRCAADSLVAHNTFSDLDDFVYYVTPSGAFAGSIDSLRILNNVAGQTRAKVYSLGAGLPPSVQIDWNLAYNASGGSIAWVSGVGNTTTLSTFRTWTGYEAHGRQGNPRFVDGLLHVAATSPAVDHGTVIAGVTGPVLGDGPDMGRYEQ